MAQRNYDPTQDLTVELTVAEAAAGYDFTVREDVPGQGYVLPGNGQFCPMAGQNCPVDG